VNKTTLVHIFFSIFILFPSLHVSADYGPIIRRNTVFLRYLVLIILSGMTVWYLGAYAPAYQTVIHTELQIPSVAKTQLFLLMMGP